MTVTIVIAGAPTLPNQSTKAGTWHARAKSRREWRAVAHWSAMAAVGRETTDTDYPIAACTIDVEHVLPDRHRRDIDNLAAAVKPLLDGFVDAGVLAGDDTTVIRAITHRASVVKGVRETRFTIEPLVVARHAAQRRVSGR